MMIPRVPFHEAENDHLRGAAADGGVEWPMSRRVTFERVKIVRLWALVSNVLML
jgi:hypothetical protein